MSSINNIPLSGAQQASGGYLLPPEQGEILVNGILVETGAIQIAGDARGTSSRKTNFPIWLGRPTAGPVAEGAAKPVTGAAFGQASLTVQKFASIILFTDEQIEDLQNGDLNVLADAGVRQALSVAIDAHALGSSQGQSLAVAGLGGSVFDSTFIPAVTAAQSGSSIAAVGAPGVGPVLAGGQDQLQKAVSAAMGVLEGNGYGDPADMAVLLGFGFQQQLRDARDENGRPIYDGGTYAGQSIDPLYGLARAHTTNLPAVSLANTYTATLTTGSASVSIPAAAGVQSAIVPGAPVSGTGIPAGTFVGNVVSGGPLSTFDANGNVIAGSAITFSLVDHNGAAVDATATGSETLTILAPRAVVVHRPNVHVRVRKDVTVDTSNEATIVQGGTTFNLFQDNLTAIRYELRLGFLIHDALRSVVPIWG